MLSTNFDKKADQLLKEYLAPLAVPAVDIAAGLTAPAAVPAVLGSGAFLPVALLGLASLGMGKFFQGKWAEKNKPLDMKQPPGTKEGDIVLPPLTQGGEGFKVPQRISTPTAPAVPPETPEQEPEKTPLPLPLKAPTTMPLRKPEPDTEPDTRLQPQTSQRLSVKPTTNTTTTPQNISNSKLGIPLPIPGGRLNITQPPPTETPTNTQKTPTPVLPGKLPQAQPTKLPPIGKPEEAYPVDNDLVPQAMAMGPTYRDTSRMAPKDVLGKFFSGLQRPEDYPVPDETNSPKEVAQRFKKWKQTADKDEYNAPGAFGGALKRPY